VLNTVATASALCLSLFVWIEGGRAHWTLMTQHDARVNPLQHGMCALRAGLADGNWTAMAVRAAFIVFWPAWLAVGFMAALMRSHRNR